MNEDSKIYIISSEETVARLVSVEWIQEGMAGATEAWKQFSA